MQLFTYDTVKRYLTPKEGEKPRIPFPIAPVAGASAGVCSTLIMYPLELLKTRLTIQVSNSSSDFSSFAHYSLIVTVLLIEVLS